MRRFCLSGRAGREGAALPSHANDGSRLRSGSDGTGRRAESPTGIVPARLFRCGWESEPRGGDWFSLMSEEELVDGQAELAKGCDLENTVDQRRVGEHVAVVGTPRVRRLGIEPHGLPGAPSQVVH